MINLSDLETPKAKSRREKKESIIKDYLSCANYIRLGRVTPHKVFTYLALHNKMSRQGIQALLKKEGIYKDHSTPVMVPEQYKVKPQQLTMPFYLEAVTAG